LKFIINQNVKSILEIGTANGGTLFLFSKILKNNSTIISIDLPGGEYGGGYPFYKVPLYKSFINDNQRLFLIRANSQNINTLKRVKKYLNGEKIDLLFIDADHSYNGVKNDFEIYRNLVKDGGIIAFHDIVKHKDRINSEVDIFWNEIKKQYEHIEFVRNWDQGWGGIGVLINNK
ncbi:MAG: class I SAM-dependent methyltransferase, partial [Candidatus Dadabacteria bacterium]|nr:class I SAM-dependent methyltransferase [Candidatus Dadabacteria bacterium]